MGDMKNDMSFHAALKNGKKGIQNSQMIKSA